MLEQIDWVGGKAIKTEMDSRLEELETTIAKELKAFYRVGNALAEIRDNRLYKLKGYKSFDAYCVEEWEMHRQHAHRLINASAVVKNLYPVGNKLPENEAQIRPLVGLSPEKQREVWQAVTSRNEPVTAKAVQAVIAEERIDPTVKAQAVELAINKGEWLGAVNGLNLILRTRSLQHTQQDALDNIHLKMNAISEQVEALKAYIEQVSMEKVKTKGGFHVDRMYDFIDKNNHICKCCWIEEFTDNGVIISYTLDGNGNKYYKEEIALSRLREREV
ncbi:hypothetical protein [Beggiatoa leptomitoformis]|uniref:hypothetical protein n=1 Tax=Beggiatoa leptomitoformis TaxID=288004 RepID=UPI0007820E31|nr:hypothetical protein [Beggiatoa leptomitoformis]